MLFPEKLHLIAGIRYISHYPIFLYQGQVEISLRQFSPVVPQSEWESPFADDPTLFEQLFEQADSSPRIFKEDASIHYGIQRFPEDLLCIIGPATSGSADQKETRSYIRKHHIRDTQNFYLHKASTYRTCMILTLIGYCLTGKYAFIPPEQASTISGKSGNGKEDFLLQQYQLGNTEADIQHIPFLVEQKLYAAIRSGDSNALKELFYYNHSDYSLGTLSDSSIKQQEYQAVVTVSLAARAAIEGGVNPYDAYDINDLYLQKISSATLPTEYQALLVESLFKYCSAVKASIQRNSSSIHIAKCKQYIARHLSQPYKMQDLADYVGISSHYLGDLFRSLEGQTLKSYILRERIEAAKNMLKYSDYPVSRISSYLCFDSQSHFGATFRRLEGMTPSAYRKKYKPSGF